MFILITALCKFKGASHILRRSYYSELNKTFYKLQSVTQRMKLEERRHLLVKYFACKSFAMEMFVIPEVNFVVVKFKGLRELKLGSMFKL